MEYTFSRTEPRIENVLTFDEDRQKDGGIFQFPDFVEDLNGFYGGNVSFVSQQVPEPTALLIWSGFGLGALLTGRRRRS